MAIHKLRPRFVETVKTKGMYPDGGGLYLQVGAEGGAKSWLFRYNVAGRDRQMGLGPAHTIGLAQARELARQCREQRLNGVDPIEARNTKRLDDKLVAAKKVTFQQCAEGWMATKARDWVLPRAKFIKRRFEMYIYPKLGSLPVQKIDSDLVHQVLVQKVKDDKGALKSLYEARPPTCEEVRQYIEGTLSWAIAKRYIVGDNPASLKGPIGILLTPVKKFHVVKPHPSLPFREIGAFMAKLRAHTDGSAQFRGCRICNSPHLKEIEQARLRGESFATLASRFGTTSTTMWKHYNNNHHVNRAEAIIRRPIAAYLLEFIILTGVRIQQASDAKWEEFYHPVKLWSCPWQRTKTGKLTKTDHVVPLSDPAIAVLDALKEIQRADGIQGQFVFHNGPGSRDAHMSRMSPYNFLKGALERPDLTVHGFRASFRSWVKENYPNLHVAAEMALDHSVPGEQLKMYTRLAELLEQRRMLLDAWAAYCDRTEPLDAKVIPMRAAK
jgi:integrase